MSTRCNTDKEGPQSIKLEIKRQGGKYQPWKLGEKTVEK